LKRKEKKKRELIAQNSINSINSKIQ
jgi:hypothetical protein